MTVSVFLPEEAGTERLGRLLEALSRPGEVLFLEGGLGAGKTTLARAFVRAAGWSGVVRSPSFALVHTYGLPSGAVHHLDLYRLASPEEAAGLDLDSLLCDAGARALVEWPERLDGTRRADWTIRLEVSGDGRRATVEAPDPPRAEAILAAHTEENAP